METILCAAWPGTGKTFICEQTNTTAIEVEFWKYKGERCEYQYIKDVEKYIGKVDYIFLGTDMAGIDLLLQKGYDITFAYPDNSLRIEYLDRYIKRDDPVDFIGAFMKYWHVWLDEIKIKKKCNHLVLGAGEYLSEHLEKNEDSN